MYSYAAMNGWRLIIKEILAYICMGDGSSLSGFVSCGQSPAGCNLIEKEVAHI